MLGLTQPKIVFCEQQNIDRVRDALKQLERSVPILTIDGEDIDNILLKPKDSTNFK